ncbi:hypothetical protein CAter10_3393 [Collimonas arenae]|uniref:hypothetical protein n=1 Tax=Collimonas arenae TaxID=279058 RepID=UPI00077823DD|nr:hypothetical protein [Collimonas arenae]AMP00908.1 hypothetical protein CAter10_3393 [Collimonas arenae]
MIIFDKTEQGRAEIATRGQTVGPRLRTLLLLVDGKTADDELLRKVAGLGLGQEHLDELLQAGLIQISSSPATHAAAPIATASITTTTPPLRLLRQQAHQKQQQWVQRFLQNRFCRQGKPSSKRFIIFTTIQSKA